MLGTRHQFIKIILFTGLALIAFAANSVLCRLALGESAIDASSFTIIRLFSGSLWLLVTIGFSKSKTSPKKKGSWSASFFLFLYAITFSFVLRHIEHWNRRTHFIWVSSDNHDIIICFFGKQVTYFRMDWNHGCIYRICLLGSAGSIDTFNSRFHSYDNLWSWMGNLYSERSVIRKSSYGHSL